MCDIAVARDDPVGSSLEHVSIHRHASGSFARWRRFAALPIAARCARWVDHVAPCWSLALAGRPFCAVGG
jgi:hypothetical protein